MPQRTIVIETEEGQKSRSFSAELLAYVVANSLWGLGSSGKGSSTCRPVLLAYAATDQASRAFSANLLSGQPAVLATPEIRFEVPRSARFRHDTYPRNGATLSLVYNPSVFAFQPDASDAGTIGFVCLPPTWWVEQQLPALVARFGQDAREAAIAAYFVAYLDQRSHLPIYHDLDFHLSLYRAALEHPWCRRASEDLSSGFCHDGLETIGCEPAICCDVDPERFADFLRSHTAQQLPKLTFKETKNGASNLRPRRRLLPDPEPVAARAGFAR